MHYYHDPSWKTLLVGEVGIFLYILYHFIYIIIWCTFSYLLPQYENNLINPLLREFCYIYVIYIYIWELSPWKCQSLAMLFYCSNSHLKCLYSRHSCTGQIILALSLLETLTSSILGRPRRPSDPIPLDYILGKGAIFW